MKRFGKNQMMKFSLLFEFSSIFLDIEDEYDISFDDGNLLFENFNRIGDLRGIIEKLQGGE